MGEKEDILALFVSVLGAEEILQEPEETGNQRTTECFKRFICYCVGWQVESQRDLKELDQAVVCPKTWIVGII